MPRAARTARRRRPPRDLPRRAAGGEGPDPQAADPVRRGPRRRTGCSSCTAPMPVAMPGCTARRASASAATSIRSTTATTRCWPGCGASGTRSWRPTGSRDFSLVGLLNDDTQPGRRGPPRRGVHRRGRTAAGSTSGSARSSSGAFAEPSEVRAAWDRLETWSQLVAEALGIATRSAPRGASSRLIGRSRRADRWHRLAILGSWSVVRCSR